MNKYPDNVEYNKLVRDRIPEIIEESGLVAETRKLGDEEYLKLLKEKLLEEGGEVIEAESSYELKKELADILEILVSLAEVKGITIKEVEEIRKRRGEKRGRFKEKIFLIRTKKK